MSAIPELNAVQLAGRLARPPKAKKSRRGFDVAELTVILTKTRTRGDTETVTHTYVIVEFWDRPATKLLKLELPAGTGIMIEGILWLAVWNDLKTGAKKNRLIVMGNTFKVLDTPDAVYEPEEGP
jgi:single-stranded DNA-binding protein